MKKLFPLLLIALFVCMSLAFADRTPTVSSTDVSYRPDGGTSSTTNKGDEVLMPDAVIDGSADVAPYRSDNGSLPVITAYRDSVLAFDPQTPTGDIRILGVEFANNFFWITGAGDGTGADSVHKFDAAGNLVATYPQACTSAWGWRDLAWDGSYLYASDSDTLVQLDISSGAPVPTGVGIPGPQNPNRALAYDPATDHFWTANFGSNIYEFDRTGAIINSYPNSKSIYGMAWDAITPGGPWLWVHSQDGTPGMEISLFNPSTGIYTAVSWQSDLIDGNTSGIAGGACFTTEWSSPLPTLFVVGQGSPVDFVYGYDMTADATTGSCCDDPNSDCVNNVLQSQCPSTSRWTANTLCDDLQPPCGPAPPCAACPPNGIPEGEEDCYDDWVDTTNTGCNATPPAPYVYTSINLGDTICGTAGTFVYLGSDYRDTDWYRLVLTSDATLTWTGVAEFPMHLFIIDAGSEDCVDLAVLTDGGAEPCSLLTLSATVTAGVYWLWAGPDVFTGVPCGSEYWVTVDTAAAPTGACCVGEDCVATNSQSECDALQGDWYAGEDCGNFVCPRDPVECDDSAVYSNGTPLDDYGSPASQCAPDYPFAAGAVDDIMVTSNIDFQRIVTWTTHWAGNVGGPAAYDGVIITLYYDDVTIPGQPAGEPIDTCEHTEYSPGGIYLSEFVPINNIFYILDTTGCAGSQYRMEIPLSSTVTLLANTQYWLEIQPVMPFGAPGGQVAIQLSNTNTGAAAKQIFTLAGLPVWTTITGNSGSCGPTPGTYFDLAFCLLPAAGGGACDYIVGDVNGSNNFNGLDVTYGVNFFKYGSPAPQCPPDCPPCAGWHYCGDVNNSCNYNGLDITYSVNYFKYGSPGPMPCDNCPPNP